MKHLIRLCISYILKAPSKKYYNMLKQHILDIFYAITAIRKVQHIKTSSEKIYQYLHKINKDAEKNLIISTIENLVRNGYLKVEGEGEMNPFLY